MKRLSINQFSPLSYAGAEAVNMLCTNLSFSGENVKKILMTSCHASEGKSYLAMNTMRTMAKLGKRVVLVDADLRRSVIAQQYALQFDGEEQAVGLSHFLRVWRMKPVCFTKRIFPALTWFLWAERFPTPCRCSIPSVSSCCWTIWPGSSIM